MNFSKTNFLQRILKIRERAMFSVQAKDPAKQNAMETGRHLGVSRNSPGECLSQILKHYSDPGRFARMPLTIQSAVCDAVLAQTKLTESGRECSQGRSFVQERGLEQHRALMQSPVPPAAFRHWCDFAFFTRMQRSWQNRVYHASLTLRNASRVATGTDELATLIADQIGREVPGARSCGQIYTAPEGGRGRRPAIEASVRHGLKHPGMVALDGKDHVIKENLLKVAEDARCALTVYPQCRWIQSLIVLPNGQDIRSGSLLTTALAHRVIIATTALPCRPMSMAS